MNASSKAALDRVQDDRLRASAQAALELYSSNPPQYGAVDIACWGPDRSYIAAAAAAAVTLLVRREESPAFSRVVIVEVASGAAASVIDNVVTVLSAFEPTADPEAVRAAIGATVSIVTTNSADTDVLLGAVASVPANAACIVHDAGGFRDLTTEDASPEREWVQHLLRTARRVDEVAHRGGLYVLMMAGRYAPSEAANREALQSAPGAVSCAQPPRVPDECIKRWATEAQAGHLDRVLTEMEESALNPAARAVAAALFRGLAGDARAYEQLAPEIDNLLATLPVENVRVIADLAARNAVNAEDLLQRIVRAGRRELVGATPVLGLAIAVLEERLRTLERLDDHAPEFASLVAVAGLVFEHLAVRPRDAMSRVRLANLFLTESAGSSGLVLLVWLAMNRFAGPPSVPSADLERASASPGAFLKFYRSYWEARAQGGSDFTLTPEPLSVPLDVTATELLEAGVHHLQVMASEFTGDNASVDAVKMIIKVCIDLSLAAGGRRPAEILRVAGAGLMASGNPQVARDLAEQALVGCGPGSTSLDRWAAWVAFADVYHRGHHHVEALIGYLCACAVPDVTVTSVQAFPAMTLLARIFRDVGHFGAALAQVERCRSALGATPYFAANAYQVDELASSVRLAQLLRDGGDVRAWQSLVNDLGASVRRAIDDADIISVPAIMLAQALRTMVIEGIPVPAESRATLEAAERTAGEPLAARLRAFAAPAPGLEQIRAVFWAVGQARYARDLGEDLVGIGVLARRALSNPAGLRNSETALITAELLADHSVRPSGEGQGGGDSREPNTAESLLRDPASVLEFVRELSTRSRVQLLALSESGSLVNVPVIEGQVRPPILEPKDVFDAARAVRWSELERPRLHEESDARLELNAMERRMRGIGFTSAGRPAPRVLVRSHELGDLPANLLLAEGELIGNGAPVTSVPSLSWLAADLRRPLHVSGRRSAWLLPEDGENASALTILHDELQRSLPAHGVELHHGPVAPRMSGSSVAIVAGHGAIWHRERYFRRVSGEEGSAFTSAELRRSLRNSAVVALLVCSGGRLDRDLGARRAIGLPHLLLGDGCRVVAASPWPIDAAMAGRWAGLFLEALDLGFEVGEAAHYANLELRDRTTRVTDFLAMHIYGNPFVTVAR